MDQKLSINLFGTFEARLNGVPVRMPTRKVELILALLAIEPDVALGRSTLAGLIWGTQGDDQARTSLRQAIYRLKLALEPSDALEVTQGWIKLKGSHVRRDVDALTDDDVSPNGLPFGLPLDGLAGFDLEIEERLDAARGELRARLLGQLEKAQTAALEDRRFTDLEVLARRHLVLDGYDEGALRMLMTALWRQGRRNAALEQFREASRRIRTELSVEVSADTLRLFRDIRIQGDMEQQPAGKSNVSMPVSETILSLDPVPHQDEKPAVLPYLRHLAVMHVISERILVAMKGHDPEEIEAASRTAIAAIEVVVRREGGVIAGRTGHQLSCIFGAVRPDESPALSAALAAFEVASLDCAVGLDASRALVGGDLGTFPITHLAQSLAEEARPGEVRLTRAVADACTGAFDLEPVNRAAKGEPASWRLTGEVLSRGGFDIRRARGLTPFVGRADSLRGLAAAGAAEGPRAVLIVGEAGMGKSRLVHEHLAAARPASLLRVQFLQGDTGGGLTRFASALRPLLPGGQGPIPTRRSRARFPTPSFVGGSAPLPCFSKDVLPSPTRTHRADSVFMPSRMPFWSQCRCCVAGTRSC